MYELIYTSARQGILPGRSGFSTVACTIGIPPNLISPIENLSAYKPLFLVGDPQAENNPVSISGRIFTFGQTRYQIISRTGFAGADYTGRTNKISHHLILPLKEHLLENVPGGMISIAMTEDNFQTEWKNADPKWLNPRQNMMTTPLSPGIAVTWKKYMGDVRWAGLAAAAYHDNPTGSLYVEYPLGMPVRDLLKLFSEIVLLLPLEEQQLFTFDTYAFQTGISASGCFLRAVPEGTPLLDNIRRHRPEELFSLIEKKPFPEYYEDNPFVQMSQGKTSFSEDNVNNTLVLKPLQQDEAPETIPLRNTVSQEETHVLASAPAQDMKREPVRTEKNESGNYKLLFFLSLILLTLCIIMLLFQHAMNSASKTVSENPAAEEPIKTIPPSPMNEQTRPIEKIPEKAEALQKETDTADKKIAKPKQPVKKKSMQNAVAVKGTNVPIREKPGTQKKLELNGAERVYLFSKIYLEKQKQFLLPGRLKKCRKVSFKFSKIGEHSINESERPQYTSITNSGMKVFAVSAAMDHSKISYTPFEKSFFSMDIQDGQIIIRDVNTDYNEITHRFTIENIKEIKFEDEKESFQWNCQLVLKEDVKYISPGRLDFNNKKLVYTKSKEEKNFEERFALPSGNNCRLEIKFFGHSNLSEINRLIFNWNRNLIKYNELQKSYNNSSKEYKKMQKEYIRLTGEELESLKYTEKDFTQKQLDKIKKHWLSNYFGKDKNKPSRTEAELYRKLQRQNNLMYQDILKEGENIIRLQKEIKQDKDRIDRYLKEQITLRKELSDYGLQNIVNGQNIEQIGKDTSAGEKLIKAVNGKTTRYFVTEGLDHE